MTLKAGSRLHKTTDRHSNYTIQSSSLYQQIVSFGIEPANAVSIVKRYKQPLLEEWVDITLAAEERFGTKFFKTSKAAYFINNVSEITKGKRTSEPPDWWLEIRREEQRKAHQESAEKNSILKRFGKVQPAVSFDEFLRGEGLAQFEKIAKDMTRQLVTDGAAPHDASDQALNLARRQMKVHFQKLYPGQNSTGPVRLSDMLDLN